MSLADIREQITEILSSVNGVDVVHQYQRWSSDWKKFLDLFRDANGTINGWIITRNATPEKWLTNVKYLRVYEFTINGIYGLKDDIETELAFQALIEDICDAFRGNDTLNDTCETIAPELGSLAGHAGIQVAAVENRMFGGVLCHFCDLKLGAQVTGTR